uniref:Uncharacterized protein n=1 Tax=Arundo donax TaxID=35708 RepID=A0A0A9ETW5_ARUDO
MRSRSDLLVEALLWEQRCGAAVVEKKVVRRRAHCSDVPPQMWLHRSPSH